MWGGGGGRGGMNPEEYYSNWKFGTTSIIGNNRATNLSYGILCEPLGSDNKYKEGHKIRGNYLVNQNN